MIVKAESGTVESAWTALAQGCDGEDDSAAEITFVNDIDVEEIPPSLHCGAFVYLEDRHDPAGTPPFEFYPDSATPLTDAKAFMFCHCKQCDKKCLRFAPANLIGTG
ncbi:hypothetical protein B0H14DRAFT_2654305 [Mycena olivaceomarginata]|nr:hypothetical protein B0H14DRAFT_2654305 [Mycena olivaceomarginata]